MDSDNLQIQSADNLIETEALIEQHLHGGFGIDFANCKAEDFTEFSKKIIKYGVIGFFPTLATDSTENIAIRIKEIKKAQAIQAKSSEPMAKILGVHLEACFLNFEKKGIHDESLFLQPTVENYQKIEDEIIKIVTLAPELDKDYELCDYLKSRGVRVSAGHCIGDDLSHVQQVTHLFNAMGAFSHRKQSTVRSALANDDVSVELIADFEHVEKDALKIAFCAKPKDKIILISDALPITHSNNEKMLFCGKIIYLKNGKAIDFSGTMAGSTNYVCDCIKKIVESGLLDLKTAVSMASKNVDFIEKPKASIFWDKDCIVRAMKFNNDLITF